jgi:hypothetical protein
MDKIRDHISAIKVLIEDASVQPQHAIAYTNKLIYYALVLSKDSFMFEMRNNPRIKHKDLHTKYFVACVKMEEVDQQECACGPNIDCTWMRSVQYLPKFRTDKLDVVKPTDTINQDAYGYVMWNDIVDIKRSRNSQRLNNKYSLRNVLGKDRLYIHIFEKAKPKYVSILGEFEDIFDLIRFSNSDCGCKDSDCNFLDKNLDIPAAYKKNIFSNTIMLLKQMSEVNTAPDRKTDDIDASKSRNNA